MYRVLILASIALGLALIGCGATHSAHEQDSPKDKRKQALLDCQANLKNIDAALKEWSKDTEGKEITDLSPLVPKYLSTLPNCPVVNQPTYRLGQDKDNFKIVWVQIFTKMLTAL